MASNWFSILQLFSHYPKYELSSKCESRSVTREYKCSTSPLFACTNCFCPRAVGTGKTLSMLHFSPLAVGFICNSSSSLVIAVAPSDYRWDMILRVYPRKFTCYNINVVNHDALLNSVLIIWATGNMAERREVRGRMEMSLRRRETGQHLLVYKDEQRSSVGYALQHGYIRNYYGMYSMFKKQVHG